MVPGHDSTEARDHGRVCGCRELPDKPAARHFLHDAAAPVSRTSLAYRDGIEVAVHKVRRPSSTRVYHVTTQSRCLLAQFVRITASVSVSKPRYTKPLRLFGIWGCTLW